MTAAAAKKQTMPDPIDHATGRISLYIPLLILIDKILCVQEFLTHLYSNFLYSMSKDFLDIQYVYIKLEKS